MAVVEVLQYPDPRLKRTCEPVDEITPEIRNIVADMVETMYASRGVGLAAPQIGIPLRIIVIDPEGPEGEPQLRVLINPQLEMQGEPILSEQEGCLSVPFNYRADVKRYPRVRITATDLEGNAIDEEWEDFLAIIAQHEFDHLKGVLFIDHISRLRRSLLDAKVKKCLNRTS